MDRSNYKVLYGLTHREIAGGENPPGYVHGDLRDTSILIDRQWEDCEASRAG